jgi:hypothetical protein
MLLGKTWGCGRSSSIAVSVTHKLKSSVVLLDEADVFLERRQISDLQRNALVSGE